MRGRAAALVLAAALALSLCGCGDGGINYQLVDLTYSFERAQVRMPDGSVVSGTVERWTDYGDSDMVQVIIDGVAYYTHGENVVLMSDKGAAP